MYKISKANRDAIIQYLLSSTLPINSASQIVNLLNSLEEIKEQKESDKK